MGSLVDSSYELIDPCPDVHALFVAFDSRFFAGRLGACEVKWSPRMTTCAGICCYEVRTGLCSIRLSTPLLKLRPRKDLVETLLHEMIHAFLFVTARNQDRDGHGPEFQKHMHRINAEAGTRITIYHSFHAEVAVYKNHHWRCSGPCRERRPYFGWVKRTTNRAPSKNDLWWAEHERSCGGKYVKVSEPKEFTEKREKAAEKEKKKAEGGGERKRGGAATKGGGAKAADDENPKKQPRIDAVFGGGGGTKIGTKDGSAVTAVATVGGGGGQMLGGGVGRSRLLDLFGGGSTVAKENRSDEKIVMIDLTKEDRPRLRGGSSYNLEKDTYEEDDGKVLDDGTNYDDFFDVGGGEHRNELHEPDEFSDNDQPMPKLTAEDRDHEHMPSTPNRRRRYDIVMCEKMLAEMNADADETGEFPMEKWNNVNEKLAILRDEEAAWQIQNEEQEALKKDDERIMRKIRGGGREEKPDSDVEILTSPKKEPEDESIPLSPNAQRRFMIAMHEKTLKKYNEKANYYFEQGNDEVGMEVIERCQEVEEKLKVLRCEEEAWKMAKDGGGWDDAPLISARKKKERLDEDKENRRKKEEKIEEMEEISMESGGIARRKRGYRRVSIQDTDDESHDPMMDDEEEKPEKREEEGEVEMEEVSIVRRVTKAISVPIEQWILWKKMPRADPVYKPIGVMTRRKKDWTKEEEEWRRKEEAKKAAAAAASAAGKKTSSALMKPAAAASAGWSSDDDFP